MARRGFFAELNHQAKLAQRDADRRKRAAAREHEQTMRQVVKALASEEKAIAAAQKAAETLQKQLERAKESERKRLEKEAERERKELEKQAKAAHLATMEATVQEKNAGLAETFDAIDSLLVATLDVDDYVDLDSLRATPDHPPFDRPDLETPTLAARNLPLPNEPKFVDPEPVKGFLGRKKKAARALEQATAAHEEKLREWNDRVDQIRQQDQRAADGHAAAEAKRTAALAKARDQYAKECSQRDFEAAEHNASIDQLHTNLGYGDTEAVQEYVSIVLSNSAYPDEFQVEHQPNFEPTTAELQLRVLVPPPDTVPGIKAYKYTKASDEITSTALTQEARKDRYSEAVNQVSLRTLHEIFEADRRGLIKSISLEVGTETLDPATGLNTYVPFVATAADRDTFITFDLSAVVPSATLAHLGASVSKNPLGRVPATIGGVRRS